MKNLLLLFFTIISFLNFSQVTLLSPTGDGGFETGATAAANGWTATVGTATQNQWIVGSGYAWGGSRGAYITNNTSTALNSYTTSAARVSHLYRNFTLPTNTATATLSFYWKGTGESCCDYMSVYFEPATNAAPTYGTQKTLSGTAPTGIVNASTASSAPTTRTLYNISFAGYTNSQQITINIPSVYFTNTAYRLTFEWRNDGSAGASPPAAIDNVSITYTVAATPTITSLGSSSGCVGSNLVINGTNLTGATAANVKIGGTAVTSIVSNTGTVLTAVVGSGTTGTVSVTTGGGTATSSATFTVNPIPTISYAGSPFTYTQNTSITNLTPTTTGTSFSSTLPTGLSINTGTGVISGTPTTTQTAANYTITATANSCTNTTSISIAVRPSNDVCSNATSLPCATSALAGTTVGSILETSPNSLYVGGYGVWYTFVGDGQETTVSATSSIDLGMYIGYGTCASRTEVLSVDDYSAGGTESITFVATNGTTYYVYIAYYGVSVITGTFTISRTCTPAYTPCSSITSLSCGLSTTFSISSGNGAWDPIVNSCGYSTPGKETIFSFTPSITGNYTLSQPSSFDYIDWFYKTSSSGCNNTGWTCIDDISDLNLGNTNVNIPLTAGITYYLMADPESTIGGNVTFTLNCACNTPTNAGTLSVSPSNAGTVNDNFTFTTIGNVGTITSLEYSFNNFTSVAGTFTNPINPFDLIINSYQSQVWVRTTSVNGLCAAGTTTPVLVTLQLAPPYSVGTTSGDYITNVTLNNLNNTSTYDSPLGDSYQDFTSLSANVVIGSTYSLSVSATQTSGIYQGYAAWIDYNNNGTFETIENVMIKSPLSLTQTQSITIPSDAYVGLVKMRVLSRRNGTPSNDAYFSTGYNRGEIEEYRVNIQSALPIELYKFDGINKGNDNYIFWVTASEQNTSYFNLQKSRDGENWETIMTLSAAGNSNTQIDYDVVDYKVEPIVNYYRLQQYDNDGVYETFGPISINNMNLNSQKTIIKYLNLNGQEIDPDKLNFMDVYIEVYDDGTMRKIIK